MAVNICRTYDLLASLPSCSRVGGAGVIGAKRTGPFTLAARTVEPEALPAARPPQPRYRSRVSIFDLRDKSTRTVFQADQVFEAPNWSLRVSLANLDDEAYEEIGRGVRSIARGYRDAHEAAKRAEKARKAVA